ncbi:MAG: hypothetical protein WC143_08195 [Eubacteriales bacterium]|jgi:hypothetical protein|nr:hypothetical protein [Clostridia bacterium]
MPLDTTAMTYSTTRHMYILEIVYLKNEMGIDLETREGSATKAKDKAYQVSRTIYNFIYNHHLKNKRYWEYFLAFDIEVRAIIQNCLEEQMRYEWESNASMLEYQIGVNLLNGTKISQDDLRGKRRIAVAVEDILRNYENGMLIFSGREMYLSGYAQTEYDYTEMGY